MKRLCRILQHIRHSLYVAAAVAAAVDVDVDVDVAVAVAVAAAAVAAVASAFLTSHHSIVFIILPYRNVYPIPKCSYGFHAQR